MDVIMDLANNLKAANVLDFKVMTSKTRRCSIFREAVRILSAPTTVISFL